MRLRVLNLGHDSPYGAKRILKNSKTERGCGHEGGDVSQTEVLGQGVEVVGAKGKASFRYLGGAAQKTGMDREGAGSVMTEMKSSS